MQDKLKLCPFCGGKAMYFYRESKDSHGWSYEVDHGVSCNSIDCYANMGTYETKEEAISAWNRRVEVVE